MDSIQLINDEYTNQRVDHGYTEAHDDQHVHGEIGRAGICYAEVAVAESEHMLIDMPPAMWPEGWEFRPESSQIEYLVKAAALLAAEIDRLLRKANGVSR